MLIGTPVDFKRFYLEKVQYHQYTQSQKIHWTLITQEMTNFSQFFVSGIHIHTSSHFAGKKFCENRHFKAHDLEIPLI